MPGSRIIDLALWLVFVIGATAVLASVATELIARFLGLRGAYLLCGLGELLDGHGTETDLTKAQSDYNAMRALMRPGSAAAMTATSAPASPATTPGPQSAAGALLGSPILRSQGMIGQISSRRLIMQPARRPGHPAPLPAGAGRRPWRARRSLPSYIPARSFSVALIDLLVPDAAGRASMNAVSRQMGLLPASMSTLRASLQPLVTSAGDDIGAFRASVEHWYDAQMDHVSGRYKRHVAKITLAVGAILVLLLNINVITIGRTLYASSTAGTAVSSVAAKGISCPVGQGQKACLADLQAQLSAAADADLPIGWATVPDCVAPNPTCNWLDQRGIFSRHGGSGWQLVLVLVGFLITITVLVPGARFWFDLLGRFGSLRTTGPRPGSSPGNDRPHPPLTVVDSTRLYELFLALFRSEAELRRFLVLEGRMPSGVLASQTGSLPESAFGVARALQLHGLVDVSLFAALERRSPERSQDIEDVARYYGVGVVRAVPGQALARGTCLPSPMSCRRRSPSSPSNSRPILTRWRFRMSLPGPWIRTTGHGRLGLPCWGSFQPRALRPLAGSNPQDPALLALADFAFTSFDGSWVLRQEFRIPCLQRLLEESLFTPALDANQHLPDLHRDLIRRLLDGWEPTLALLGTRELEALDVVAGWLEPVFGTDLGVSRAAINAAMERRLLLDPLRTLVGTHFRDRTGELDTIRQHILGLLPEHILLVQGPGGVGKSSLMGKVLLDLEARATSGQPVSFAYIDFDRARHDPHDPIGLVEQVARQLRLLYATAAEASQFAAVEAMSAGTDLERAAEILQIERSRTVPAMVGALAERLRAIRGQHSPSGVSLVLVLDTFEEVQIRGPGAAHTVLDLVRQLQEALPDMRVMISGRGVIREPETTGSARACDPGGLGPRGCGRGPGGAGRRGPRASVADR